MFGLVAETANGQLSFHSGGMRMELVKSFRVNSTQTYYSGRRPPSPNFPGVYTVGVGLELSEADLTDKLIVIKPVPGVWVSLTSIYALGGELGDKMINLVTSSPVHGIELFLFQLSRNLPPPSDLYGLEVFDDSGARIFTSDSKVVSPLKLFKATSESPDVFGVTPTMAVGSFSAFIPCVTVDNALGISATLATESVDFRLSGSTLETRTLVHEWSMDSEPPAATYRDVYAYPHHPIYNHYPVSFYYHRDLFLVETAHLPIPYG